MRTRTFALLTGLCLASGLAFATQFTGLQQKMTPQEFLNAGLNKLSAQELAALDSWIQREMQEREAIAAAAPRPDRAGFSQAEDHAPVVSRILGDFRGWQGNTRFVLENGQVWVQAESGMFGGIRLKDPAVTISRGVLGDWKLRVEGYNSRLKVKRVK